MSVAVITGSAGLLGSQAVEFFCGKGFDVVGIDNDLRSHFFGKSASTSWVRHRLEQQLRDKYTHLDIDIRDQTEMLNLFTRYGKRIKLVVHAAAQPSHEWATKDPFADFEVNAQGTLNLLEATRRFASDAVFIFSSTNKVYGDHPNSLPLIEYDSRWEIDPLHECFNGISEKMPIDRCVHSLFGVSKLAADLLVQEYGRYFGMRTVCFRCGCLTGPGHSAAELHGFLAYLMRCCATGASYTIFGYKGKQVRDNIHSSDVVRAFDCFFENPGFGEVYNLGGGRDNSVSMLEAIRLCEEITGRKLNCHYVETNRQGDHKWWITDCSGFKSRYSSWSVSYRCVDILRDIYESNATRWYETLEVPG
jgi:CDP-paratose 2-epimerase